MNLVGKTINGYVFIEFINEGGFGAVYKAEKAGVIYAIKLFREAYVLKEFRRDGHNRLEREIEIMQKVSGPNLVSYIEHFEYQDNGSNYYFLVMDFVDGETLRTILDRDGQLDEATSKNIILQVLDGLEVLHNLKNGNSSGIIHRDLKPENIIMDRSGVLKIVDYGISKVIDFTSITSTGDVLGTGPYMSPEQITDSKNIDRRSDLYTVGILYYELLTNEFPYDFQSAFELAEKIKVERPMPPRRKVPGISNATENIILSLLEKEAYKRPVDVSTIRASLLSGEPATTLKEYDLTPKFILHLNDDKTVLTEYLPTISDNLTVVFPANLSSAQKGLLSLIQGQQTRVIVDPATVRLAYDTYADTKGLVELPYSRKDFQAITPDYLSDYKVQKAYVKSVIDTEHKLGADVLLSPFHYTHNSNVSLATRNMASEWLDLDIKLLMEAIDYRNSSPELKGKELYAGICLHHTSINDERDRKYILNTFSLFDVDGYIVYVDSIDKESSKSTLYSYIKLVTELQQSTGKPVIAGRMGQFGLGLLCAGITGFTSGTARFESFYEGLYKEDTGPAYNMYERYYYPELLSCISIKKKDPTRFDSIAEFLPPCDCPYCIGKSVTEIIQAKNNKFHFLYKYKQEVNAILALPEQKRIPYFLSRIEVAIDNYAKMSPKVFGPSDYKHLQNWQEVFSKLQ